MSIPVATRANEVHVIVDETRQDCLAFEIRHYGIRIRQTEKVFAIADRKNSVAFDRERFRNAELRVGGKYLSVRQDPVRGGLRLGGWSSHWCLRFWRRLAGDNEQYGQHDA
jgi:hypothetical protein